MTASDDLATLRWFWCPSCTFVIWAFREDVPWYRIRRCTSCRGDRT